jgi:hypothetical protein
MVGKKCTKLKEMSSFGIVKVGRPGRAKKSNRKARKEAQRRMTIARPQKNSANRYFAFAALFRYIDVKLFERNLLLG